MEFLSDILDAFWRIMLDSGVWLIAGLALAGVVHAFVPRDFLARHLASDGSRSRIVPILKASLLGIPLPLCSCSVIPVAAGLRSSGAGRGASAAFAISTPQTGEESVPLTWALFGPVFALTRPVVAVVTALTAGVLIEWFTPDGARQSKAGRTTRENAPAGGKACCSSASLTIGQDFDPEADDPTGDEGAQIPNAPEAETASCCGGGRAMPAPIAPSSCCASGSDPAPAPTAAKSCCGTPAAPTKACCSGGGDAGDDARHSVAGRTRDALRHGFVTMLLDLAPWLAVGLVLSAVIAALVPEGWIGEHIGTGLVPMLLMLVVGLPLYVCATSSTPLAFALVAAGLSPGAALVLLLAGPATNAATMSWVVKDLGVRALGVYLAVIAAFAVGTGLAFDALLGGMVRLAEQGAAHDHSVVSVTQSVGAGLFTLMLLVAVGVRIARRFRTRTSALAGEHACA